ncbi:MAG: GAF domain-containing protein [Spirochaetales bacterium]|nr:MAG: GAF domain-containing protein [Spirochaetales bacterium]
MEELVNIKKLYSSIGKIITSSLEFGVILDSIMEEIHLFFDAANWSLMRLDPNTDELFFVIVKGIDTKAVENIRLGMGEGIAGTVARTKRSIFVSDTSRDRRFSDRVDRATGFKTKSVMAVPIVLGDTLYGVIELVNRTTGGLFTEMEHIILQTIADYAAIALRTRRSMSRRFSAALPIRLRDSSTGRNWTRSSPKRRKRRYRAADATITNRPWWWSWSTWINSRKSTTVSGIPGETRC